MLFNSVIIFAWLIRFYFLNFFTKTFESEIKNPKEKEGYKLTFEDEFDNNIDWKNKWNDYYSKNTETPNDRIKHSSDCIKADNGLKLFTKKIDTPFEHWWIAKSGYLCSKGKFSQMYGYFEVRVLAPKSGKLFWGAPLWLYAENLENEKSENPPEEVDLAEYMDVKDIKRGKTTCLTMTNHFGKVGGKTMQGCKLRGLKLSEKYHTIGLKWDKNSLTWFFNNVAVYKLVSYIPHVKMCLVSNIAAWKEIPPEEEDFDGVMLIDSIRVWKKAK